MKAPSITIKNVLRALCLIIYPAPTEKMKDADGLRFVTDWWQASLKVLGKPNLLGEMTSLNVDNLEEKIVKNLGTFLQDPEYKESLKIENVE